jgi:hypothetical protein
MRGRRIGGHTFPGAESIFSSLCGAIPRPAAPLPTRAPRRKATLPSGRAPGDFKMTQRSVKRASFKASREFKQRQKSLPFPSISGSESGFVKGLAATPGGKIFF